MAKRIKIEGLRELDKALAELPKATGRAVLRRVGIKALMPMRDAAEAAAPKDTGRLAKSIIVSSKRPKGEKSAGSVAFAKARAGGQSVSDARTASRAAGAGTVMVFMGPGRDPAAIMQEFGTSRHGPQSFMRPAWDGGVRPALESIKDDLWFEIKKSAERLAKKQARLAAKAGS